MKKKKIHPLRRWLFVFGVTSGELGEMCGINAATIRRLCSFKNTSRENVKTLSRVTGIPALVLFLPEEHVDFDVSNCKPSMDALSDKSVTV